MISMPTPLFRLQRDAGFLPKISARNGPSQRRLAPNSATSSASQTSIGSNGSASSGATRKGQPFAELLIDCEEDRVLRAVLVWVVHESTGGSSGTRSGSHHVGSP